MPKDYTADGKNVSPPHHVEQSARRRRRSWRSSARIRWRQRRSRSCTGWSTRFRRRRRASRKACRSTTRRRCRPSSPAPFKAFPVPPADLARTGAAQARRRAPVSLHRLCARRAARRAAGTQQDPAARGDEGPHHRAGRARRDVHALTQRERRTKNEERNTERERGIGTSEHRNIEHRELRNSGTQELRNFEMLTRRDLLKSRGWPARARRCRADKPPRLGLPRPSECIAQAAARSRRARAAAGADRGGSRPARRDRRAADSHRCERSGRARGAGRALHRSRARRRARSDRARRIAPGLPRSIATRGRRAARRSRRLSPTDQDSVLIDVETGAATGSGAGFDGSSARSSRWCARTRMQGTFGDPFYGGNANFVGWDLIGYPGVRTIVTADEQRLGAAARADPPIGLRPRDVQQGHRATRGRRRSRSRGD